MDLDGFVCACIVVKSTLGLYEKCNAGGRTHINRDDFLQAVISLPSGGARGPDPVYPIADDHSRSRQGNTPQRGGFSRPDDGADPSGFGISGITSLSGDNQPISHTNSLYSCASQGSTPSISQDEYGDFRSYPLILTLICGCLGRCRALFFAIDQNGDGTLSFEELRTYS